MDLKEKRCIPCEGGVDKLSPAEATRLLEQLVGWALSGSKIEKAFTFRDFVTAMRFVNHMAKVAEQEGHHPDFAVHYNVVKVTIWTHAIGGLSENDFILASKIDVGSDEP